MNRNLHPETLPSPALCRIDVLPTATNHLRWMDATGLDETKDVCLDEVVYLVTSAANGEISIAGITVIVFSTEDGEWLAEKLESLSIPTVHVFTADKRAACGEKTDFYNGDVRVKLTTIYDFKEIESRALVICLHKGDSSEMALVNTVMTQITRSEGAINSSYLTVISGHPQLSVIGKNWFEGTRLIDQQTRAEIDALNREKLMKEEELDKVVEDFFRDRSLEESKENYEEHADLEWTV